MESILGKMGPFTKEIGTIIKSMAWVNITGQIKGITTVNGLKTTCMDTAFSLMLMEILTKVNISMIKKTAMVLSFGQMEDNMTVTG